MTDGDALYAAILAHPAEDTPRLMYADHLDELGGKHNAGRAKFIRLCVAGERDGGSTWFTDRTRDEANWATKTLLRNWKTYKRLPLLQWEQPLPSGHVEKLPKEWNSGYLREQHSFGGWRPSGQQTRYSTVSGFCRLFFRRGLVSAVYCHWNFWRDFGDVVVAHEPISHIELTTPPGDGPFPQDAQNEMDQARLRFLRSRWPTVADWQLPKLTPVTA